MDFLLRIEQSSVMTWVRESGSLLGYPTILFLHTIGLATVAGLNAAIDLRLLGFALRVPLSSLTGFFRLIWIAFGVTALSGLVLLLADTAKLTSPVFYVKMAFIALALVNVRLLRRRIFANPQLDAAPLPPGARLLSATSLLLWIGATTAGRLMAYIT